MSGLPALQHPLVRALAWLIGSPGILDPAAGGADAVVSDAWCAQALAQAQPLLLRLDRNPAELEAHVQARRITRLGRLAESLVCFWLQHSERFELLAHNLAVRADGRTLGDFDLVFRDRQGNTCVHWEMAVKFYLRRPGRHGLAAYVGPTGKDVLAAKAAHIFTRQLMLGGTSAGGAALRSIGAADARARAFVKGWLFHSPDEPMATPGVNFDHGRGWWDTPRRLVTRAALRGQRFRVLERLAWLAWPAACETQHCMDVGQLAGHAALHFEKGGEPLLVAAFDGVAGAFESTRGFIVPPAWVAPQADF